MLGLLPTFLDPKLPQNPHPSTNRTVIKISRAAFQVFSVLHNWRFGRHKGWFSSWFNHGNFPWHFHPTVTAALRIHSTLFPHLRICSAIQQALHLDLLREEKWTHAKNIHQHAIHTHMHIYIYIHIHIHIHTHVINR